MAEVRPGGDKDGSNSAPAPPALGVGGSEIRAQLQPYSRLKWRKKLFHLLLRNCLSSFLLGPASFPCFTIHLERQNITISIWCLIKLGSWWTKTIFYQFRALLHTFQKKRNDQEPRTRLNISTSPKLNIFWVNLFQRGWLLSHTP